MQLIVKWLAFKLPHADVCGRLPLKQNLSQMSQFEAKIFEQNINSLEASAVWLVRNCYTSGGILMQMKRLQFPKEVIGPQRNALLSASHNQIIFVDRRAAFLGNRLAPIAAGDGPPI